MKRRQWKCLRDEKGMERSLVINIGKTNLLVTGKKAKERVKTGK